MKARAIVLPLVLCLLGKAVCFADDVFTDTWKLNEAKSKLTPGAPKNNIVVYEVAGDNVKVTIDGTDKDGKPTHNEWTGKFDGKDYPVADDPTSDARSYTKIDDRTLGFNIKKAGRVTTSGRIVVSEDGKSRTVTFANRRRARVIFPPASGMTRIHRVWQTGLENPRWLRAANARMRGRGE